MTLNKKDIKHTIVLSDLENWIKYEAKIKKLNNT